uniref:NADH-ubiquinone oxidoreductase chain 2 n=1 Tax=Ophioplinthus gelida TaxID=696348 RepID=A0A3G2WJY7_9ECHI|nr:NADH dehydrogenase subunit 2 [Ophioplinthus gelida]AYO99582.1 NADH dehydrogenase subunit 2 [Ophioplinthus gelida]
MSKNIIYLSTLLISIIGTLLSNNWLWIWFCIELNSLALIPLLSSNITPRSLESTNKYFLFQATGSALLLLGILLRMFFSGSLLLQGDYNWLEHTVIIAALCVKIGLFPTHFWYVEVMQGIPFWGGFLVTVPSKIIPVYLILLISINSSFLFMIILSILSIFIGSLFGIHQLQLRKLLALSSVAQLGWIILIFPNISNLFGVMLFSAYIIMITPLFWIGNLYCLEHIFKTNNMSNNIGLSNVFLISILSLAGFPPLLGFFYKFMIFFILLNVYSIIIVGLLIGASLLALYFYFQICFGFCYLLWPLTKTIFSNSFFTINSSLPFWTMIITNTFIIYSLWIVNPFLSALL